MSRTAIVPVLAIVMLAGCAAAAPVSPAASVGSAAPLAKVSLALSPTATPSPTVAAATFSWQRLAAIPAEHDLYGMAASTRGYTVLEARRTIWFSPDGKSWTRTTLPFDTSTSNGSVLDAWADAIVAGANGFVAVGGYDHTPCTSQQGDGGPPACARRPISWASSDGLTWHSSLATAIPSDGSQLPAFSEFARAWPAADGFDAAIEAHDSVRYHGNGLLHSRDGLVWTRLSAGPLADGTTADSIYAHGGIGATNGQRLLWQSRDLGSFDPMTSLASSLDGLSWKPIAAFDGTGVSIALTLGPDAGASGPWLLVGDRSTPASGATMAWFSEDLVTWHSGPFRHGTASDPSVSGAARGAGGYVTVGSYRAEDGGSFPVTWRSADGTTWMEVTSAEPEPVDGPTFLAAGPAGMIGLGTTGDPGAAVWIGVDGAP